MSNLIDKAYGQYAASKGSGTLSSHHHSLLSDPELVDDYQDIMQGLSSAGTGLKTEDEMSTSASVVVTSRPTTPNKKPPPGSAEKQETVVPKQALGSPLKQMVQTSEFESSTLRSKQGVDSLKLVASAGEKSRAESVSEVSNESGYEGSSVGEASSNYSVEDEQSPYCYSDSDFEESVERGLQQMDIDIVGKEESTLHPTRKPPSADKKLVGSFFKNARRASLDSSDDVEGQLDSSDEDSAKCPELEEDDNGDEYIPLPPPQELDPSKLYALYAFQGQDPSYCQLEQDQDCVLLNDQDSYWWLVKRCSDGKIGFAPAELLETFPERLARLNCWKNENLSSHGTPEDVTEPPKSSEYDIESPMKTLDENAKSVSFNEVVAYAERYIQLSASDDNIEVDSNSDNEGHDVILHIDEIHETKLIDHHPTNDGVSDIISDAAFTTADMLPLDVKKTRNYKRDISNSDNNGNNYSNNNNNEDDTAGSSVNNGTGDSPVGLRNTMVRKEQNYNIDDDLKQIFKAPVVPFSQARGNDISRSSSHNSISTIGEYSPSSSEYTNDSPQFDNDGKFTRKSVDDSFPTTRAIQDISRLVSDATDETLNIESPSVRPTGQLTNSSVTEESPFSSSSTADINTIITKADSDEWLVCSQKIQNSFSSIASTQSLGKSAHHPIIDELYEAVFERINELQQKLEKLKSSSPDETA
ncbi:HBR188Cp [Eremothecium sinecaudum]|uniref:HBR188Cp n=1 Tax=Eremothecium sinecaudum TaxID=45286 RepID=A0A109UX20_9SACH|nr:HBR188Cp [Eremothecium sinecaudum]AMD19089.1 HBR188Cp [Eremothecium sinecaudum]